MTTYIIHRLFWAVIVLIVTSIVVFLAMRLLPGDPVLMLLTQSQKSNYTVEQLQQLRHEFGLDKSYAMQYVDWVSRLFHGDLGMSILHRSKVSTEIGRSWGKTFNIGILALIIGIILGIPAGIICAVRRGGWADNIISILANIGITVPVFWLGILLMFFLSLKLKLLPVMGYTSPFEDLWMNIKQLIMPVLCVAIMPIAMTARQTRSSMLEVFQQDYIRTAWSKGLGERMIIMRHALKNALIPVVTLLGLGVSSIIGGEVLIETVFNIPGMGRLLVGAILGQDYPVAQGVILLIAMVVVLTNLVVDISYGWLDPRIRYEGT